MVFPSASSSAQVDLKRAKGDDLCGERDGLRNTSASQLTWLKANGRPRAYA